MGYYKHFYETLATFFHQKNKCLNFWIKWLNLPISSNILLIDYQCNNKKTCQQQQELGYDDNYVSKTRKY